jgi:hypothetical protein
MKLFNILDEIFPSLCKICTCKRAYWSSSIISGNWIVEIKWSRRTLERKKQVLFSKKISLFFIKILRYIKNFISDWNNKIKFG